MKISDIKLQEKIKWYPHPAQQEVIGVADKLRIVTLSAGRRFGKSANKKVWIVAPSYDLTLKVFNYLVRWFAIVAPSQVKGITYRPNPRIKTASGSILECKSTENPTSLLGEELDLVIIDEAARVSKNVWEAYLFPTTSSRQGTAIFISTPKGKNWFYHLWTQASEKGGAFQFQSKVNPTFKPEEWDYAKQTLPQDVFSQEYDANFLDDAAAVFRGVREVIADNCLCDQIHGHYYVMGCDLGKHQDFTVLTVIDTTNNKVVYIDRFNQIDWNIQKARIKVLAQRYNNARIIIDSTGIGDPITDDLKMEGLVVDDFKYTNNSKMQLIQKLIIFIEQKLISIPNNELLINELESFGYEMTDSGKISYGAPTGSHDDMVNSIALGVWGLVGGAVRRTPLQKQLTRSNSKKVRSVI
jgi:hypothetical protein